MDSMGCIVYLMAHGAVFLRRCAGHPVNTLNRVAEYRINPIYESGWESYFGV